MTTHLVTFSDSSMSRSAELCIEAAKRHGVDTHSRFTPGNVQHWAMTAATVKANPDVFRQPEDARRAWSWWAFKPLILEAEMRGAEDGSVIVYADAGIEFIDNVNYIIDRMDQDIFLFGNMYEHAHWCKGAVIEEIIPMAISPRGWTNPDYLFGKQVQASVIFFRVNDHTRAFVKEWLEWCLFEGGRLIDDSPSRTPNHPEFRENRHDQAILTTMAYRDGIKLHWWPSVYNYRGSPEFVYERGDYPDEGYPVLFSHHRRRNSEWEELGRSEYNRQVLRGFRLDTNHA